jgi:hypothetical protein
VLFAFHVTYISENTSIRFFLRARPPHPPLSKKGGGGVLKRTEACLEHDAV